MSPRSRCVAEGCFSCLRRGAAGGELSGRGAGVVGEHAEGRQQEGAWCWLVRSLLTGPAPGGRPIRTPASPAAAGPRDPPAKQRQRDALLDVLVAVDGGRNRLDDALACRRWRRRAGGVSGGCSMGRLPLPLRHGNAASREASPCVLAFIQAPLPARLLMQRCAATPQLASRPVREESPTDAGVAAQRPDLRLVVVRQPRRAVLVALLLRQASKGRWGGGRAEGVLLFWLVERALGWGASPWGPDLQRGPGPRAPPALPPPPCPTPALLPALPALLPPLCFPPSLPTWMWLASMFTE